MRIAVDIRPLMEEKLSGVGVYTAEILDHLLKVDTKNEYILFYNSFSPITKFQKAFYGRRVTMRPFFVPNKLLNGAQTFLKFPFLDTLTGSPDIFFAPNWGFVNVSSRCKLITVAHDISHVLYPQFLSTKGRLWHKVIQPRSFFHQADHIIAVSEHTKNDIMKCFNLHDRDLTVIHSGIRNFSSPDNANDLVMALSENFPSHIRAEDLPKHYIFSLGNVEPRKNIEGVIHAFQKLIQDTEIQKRFPKLQLLIAGSHNARFVQRFGCYSSIRFLGYVSEADKALLYKHAQIFLYPSFYEGFGFPPLEAALARTPSVVSHVSSLPEVIGDASLFVDPYSIDQIYTASKQLLLDVPLRNAIINRAERKAQEFSWLDAAQKTLEVFDKVHVRQFA